jgi:lipoprotein-releasing system ATP-binding protein
MADPPMADPPMADPLRLQGVQRTYRSEAADLPVLRGVDLALAAGEIVALVAPSGAGKSTLLHIAGLLDRPDGGTILLAGRDAGALSDAARTAIRRDTIGFVYQMHHLLAEFTALENVMLPQMIGGKPRRAAAARALELLGTFGLAKRAQHLPGKLSGGEQQRVAIARAIVGDASVILADEPTAALDSENGHAVMMMLAEIAKDSARAMFIVTHDPRIMPFADRILRIEDGRIVSDQRRDERTGVVHALKVAI